MIDGYPLSKKDRMLIDLAKGQLNLPVRLHNGVYYIILAETKETFDATTTSPHGLITIHGKVAHELSVNSYKYGKQWLQAVWAPGMKGIDKDKTVRRWERVEVALDPYAGYNLNRDAVIMFDTLVKLYELNGGDRDDLKSKKEKDHDASVKP